MDRRAWLAGAAGLIGMAGATAVLLDGPFAAAQQTPLPPLKSLAPWPLGTCVQTPQLTDPQWIQLATTHFNRLTPEFEMKMETVLQKDGSLRFERPDSIVAFAKAHGMAVHGHCLIWYAEDGGRFNELTGNAFLNTYVDYIQRVMGRYAGFIRTWDVVNEPVTDEGSTLRDCLWSQKLGEDYIGLAFTAAQEADPHAVLLMNEYNLEYTPKKRATLLRAAERALKNGAPLHGIGTQTHIGGDVPPGAIRAAIRDIASLGLKIHVSEVDITLHEDHPVNAVEPRADQLRVLDELVQAYHDVPAAQRVGMTFWGVRDSDSWQNAGPHPRPIFDEPLLFDKYGRPKPVARELARLLAG
jgi:endo-1,4-beta-xylanase